MDKIKKFLSMESQPEATLIAAAEELKRLVADLRAMSTPAQREILPAGDPPTGGDAFPNSLKDYLEAL